MFLEEPRTLTKSIECLLEGSHHAWSSIIGRWNDEHSNIRGKWCVQEGCAYIAEQHFPSAEQCLTQKHSSTHT
eukprot:12751021-Heterocapsa_arctica.AAC.1